MYGHHHHPSQLSYLQSAGLQSGLQYTYNNYCMMPSMTSMPSMPPVYNSINSMVAAQAHPSSTPVIPEDARDSRDSLVVSSSSAGLNLPDSNLSVVEVEAGEDRADYMEELTRERESLEQGETNHARRLIDRGELELWSLLSQLKPPLIHYRDITAPVRTHPGPHQLRGPDGGRLQGEAHQAGGEGHSSCQGTSQGKKRTFGKNLFKFLCLYSGFVIACWVHFISKSTFCVKQKNMIPLHNLNISVIHIFHLPVKTTQDDQHHQITDSFCFSLTLWENCWVRREIL